MCPSSCRAVFIPGVPLEEITCPCGHGYFTQNNQWISGRRVRNGLEPSREEYYTSLGRDARQASLPRVPDPCSECAGSISPGQARVSQEPRYEQKSTTQFTSSMPSDQQITGAKVDQPTSYRSSSAYSQLPIREELDTPHLASSAYYPTSLSQLQRPGQSLQQEQLIQQGRSTEPEHPMRQKRSTSSSVDNRHQGHLDEDEVLR